MRNRRFPSALTVLAWGILAALYVPIIVVVLYAFNADGSFTWPMPGLSTRWFSAIVEDAGFRQAFRQSVVVGIITTVLAVLIGVAASLTLARHSTWWLCRVAVTVSRLPLMLPPLFIGVALLTSFASLSLTLSTATIVVGHLIFVIPYVVIVACVRLNNYNWSFDEAARDLGASRVQVLTGVTAPIIAPAILGAALLAFGLSFDETFITNFTSGDDSTLPIFVLSRLRRTVDPSINAVATVLLTIPWISLALSALIMRRSLKTMLPKGTS